MQEYRVSNPELIAGLEARGAKVSPVPVYRWALSEDTGPLRSALEEMLAGRVDMALFTNATQVDHLFKIAAAGVQIRDCAKPCRGHGQATRDRPNHPAPVGEWKEAAIQQILGDY